ncbi:MAG: hypothetical protein HFJ51_04845, partial [Clostridia bacterium]|nr:hypothetical protein [Clostridia bacterium]
QKIAEYFGEDTYVFDIPGTVYDVEVIERPKDWLKYSIEEEIMSGRNVQVFLSSKKQIYSLMEELKYERAVILPLHGDLSFEEQQKCFARYDLPLVVLSTNIGQTGLTIPGINSVVDTGKALIPIARNGVEEICEVDISQADIEQRMWRSARTGNGRYILCSDTPIEERAKYPVPEIQRSLLDQVVLRFAAIGLDMEKMKFFHQPSISEIKAAKKLLKSIGAFDDNYNITEIGRQMSKMPVSVECARMIVEAEKYGCVEQVLTISAIVEMGGLLERQKGGDRTTAGRYSNFTDENQSDLLAELAVWNYLNGLEKIDFKAMRINRTSFNSINNHIKKLHTALSGIVEFNSNDDREAILKSCICAYSSRIFVSDSIYNNYVDKEGLEWRLDNKSCLNYTHNEFVVGKPVTIPGRYGQMNLLTFATRIDKETLIELVPNEIEQKTRISYVPSVDAVSINETKQFRGNNVEFNSYIDYQHPQLAELRAEYEKEERRIDEENRRYFGLQPRQTPKPQKLQEGSVKIGERIFAWQYQVNENGDIVPIIALEYEDIFTLEQDEVFLEDGSRVWFQKRGSWRTYETVARFRNWEENRRLAEIRTEVRGGLSRTVIKTIYAAASTKDVLGEFVLTKDNGGYGENDIFAYKCFVLKEGTVRLGVTSEESQANECNLEALKHLFMKEVSNNYRSGKFSHLSGKKKKVLTEAEQRKKEDFDAFVEDVVQEITLDTAIESIGLVEEYYQALMS